MKKLYDLQTKIIFILLFSIILFYSACGGDSPSAPVLALPGDLIITEVGSGYFANGSFWLEVYNKGSEAGNLSRYKLKTYAYDSSDQLVYMGLFDIPSLIVQPGGYAIIRGKAADFLPNGNNIVYISSGTRTPYWQTFGFAELLIDGTTNDFVRFGTSTDTPTTLGNWDASTAPALPYGETDYGKSIARDGSNTDTNISAEWTSTNFATYAGPNDITSFTDTDNDGIPDESEGTSGDTFAGLPLFDWGAETNQRDIFIHINYMDSGDEGVIPREEALQKVVAAFLAQGIAIHFDVGDLYDQSPGNNPSRFDLDDKNHKVPFSSRVTLGVASGEANLYAYKNNYMDLARKQIFHYLLFGNTQGGDFYGSSGLAEINGNDFLVTLGEWGLSSSNTTRLINFQAATIMHELGHNLGLGHGGKKVDIDPEIDGDPENENYKPNYISIMNYLYQLTGLPTDGAAEGDRYYFEYGGPHNIDTLGDLQKGPDTTDFILDYSYGTAGDLDENSIDESTGLLWGATNSVDFNLDNDVDDTGLSESINSSYYDGESATTILKDYDDWLNINLFYIRDWSSGDLTGVSIYSLEEENIIIMPNPAQDDFQQIYPEHPQKKIFDSMKQN